MILYIYVVVLLFLIVACMFLDPRHSKGKEKTKNANK